MAGITTRYWDCCKPSCSWSDKAAFTHPVATCAADGETVQSDVFLASGCDGGPAFSCTNNMPWAVTASFALGFGAAIIPGLTEADLCCACYELTFTSPAILGKKMVVQLTNTGALFDNHFDIQIPGGGLGGVTGCMRQWNNGFDAIYNRADCQTLPAPLRPGCEFRFDWFDDNPTMTFRRVGCPRELTDRTSCIRSDESNYSTYPVPTGSVSPRASPLTGVLCVILALCMWNFSFRCSDLSHVRWL